MHSCYVVRQSTEHNLFYLRVLRHVCCTELFDVIIRPYNTPTLKQNSSFHASTYLKILKRKERRNFY